MRRNLDSLFLLLNQNSFFISLYQRLKSSLGALFPFFVFLVLLLFVFLLGFVNSVEESTIYTPNRSILHPQNFTTNVTTIPSHNNQTITVNHQTSENDSIFSAVAVVLSAFFATFCILQICRIARAVSIQLNRNRRTERLNLILSQLGTEEVDFFNFNNTTLQARLRLSLMRRDLTSNDYELLQLLDDGLTSGGRRQSGASEEIISQLPLHQYSEPQNAESSIDSPSCSICLGPFSEGEELRTLPCTHQLHRQCCDQWLRLKALCPICKQSVIGIA